MVSRISHTPVLCRHCGRESCYCCPECGFDVAVGHAHECPADPARLTYEQACELFRIGADERADPVAVGYWTAVSWSDLRKLPDGEAVTMSRQYHQAEMAIRRHWSAAFLLIFALEDAAANICDLRLRGNCNAGPEKSLVVAVDEWQKFQLQHHD